jgi:hypothetical protein
VPGLVFCKGEVTCQADSSVIYATTINIILVYIQMFDVMIIYFLRLSQSNTYLELVISVRKVIEGHARTLRQRGS